MSQILTLNSLSKKGEIIIAPNPVIDKQINLQFNNIEKGKVAIDLYKKENKF